MGVALRAHVHAESVWENRLTLNIAAVLAETRVIHSLL